METYCSHSEYTVRQSCSNRCNNCEGERERGALGRLHCIDARREGWLRFVQGGFDPSEGIFARKNGDCKF